MNILFKEQIHYIVLFTLSVVLLFIFLAENMHQIQHTFRHKNMTLEYKPIRSSSKTAQQGYRLETYESGSSKFLAERKALNNNQKIDNKKNKDLDESQIVDHQIFASPNNIRSKRIFI